MPYDLYISKEVTCDNDHLINQIALTKKLQYRLWEILP